MLRLLTDGTRYCQCVFSSITFYCRQDLCDQSTPFLTDNYFILSIWGVLQSLNVIIYISFVKRENASMTFCRQPHLLPKLVFWMIRLSRHIILREEDHGKKWHRFWLCLHYTVIFIQNVQYQLQWKVNWLWTWTLIVMTAAFKRTEKKFNGFWQVDMVEFLIDERKLSMMKLDYIWSHLSTAFNSKKLFNAVPQGMASTINNFAT